MSGLTDEILAEIHKAAESLGPDDAEYVRGLPAEDLYTELEVLGADHRLLAVVGSWGDCMSDAEVLEALREWNRAGRLKFDEIYASTKHAK